MIVLIQRVKEASVTVGEGHPPAARSSGRETGRIGPGMLILLGVHATDTRAEAAWLARKCANLRIYPDAKGKMNRSLHESGGEALVVSQFTLYGNATKGNRPSFVESAPPDTAEPLYEIFCRLLSDELGRAVPTGEFGAMMDVHLVNDGPVTIWIEKRAGHSPVEAVSQPTN